MGALVRNARQARGWSQLRLIAELRQRAADDGVTLPSTAAMKVTVSRWENGHQDPGGFYEALLARAFHPVVEPRPPLADALDRLMPAQPQHRP
jgi:transcriptional regulator with XRE-family HTH domain